MLARLITAFCLFFAFLCGLCAFALKYPDKIARSHWLSGDLQYNQEGNLSMCGISGIISLDSSLPSSQPIEMMLIAQSHRGPDGSGMFQMGHAVFGHNRLALIDQAGGRQPFVDEDAQIMLTYNGEVYNYKEIRELLLSDYVFKTESDTEVILRAYQKWGAACLERFNGMFAFALYDQKKHKVFIARDRFGIKPLYYYKSSTQFIFASELHALMTSEVIPREISADGLRGFFAYQYVPAPLSIYKYVHKLEAGHYLDIDLDEASIIKKRYWKLEPKPQEQSEARWLYQLNEVLDEAIAFCCRSDFACGSFLSGGVDSSLVTALLHKHLQQPCHSFSIGFHEPLHNELPYAQAASTALGSIHHERKIVAPEALEMLNVIAVHFGEPFADSSAIPTYFASQEAAKQVKMVLSGDGGDEAFAGYDSYVRTIRDVKNPISISRRYLYKLASIMPFDRIRKTAQCQTLTHQQKHDAQRTLFSTDELNHLLGNTVHLFGTQPQFSASDPVAAFQLQDIHTYLTDDVLTKVDRMSMANSLEVRVPLLDHRLIELAFAMPLEMKLKYESPTQITSKYLLKRSANRFLDFHFLNRKKTGFGMPLQEWCLSSFKETILNHLNERNNPIYHWINFSYVQNLLTRLFMHDPSVVSKVWSILQFDLWMRNVHLVNYSNCHHRAHREHRGG